MWKLVPVIELIFAVLTCVFMAQPIHQDIVINFFVSESFSGAFIQYTAFTIKVSEQLLTENVCGINKIKQIKKKTRQANIWSQQKFH